MSILLKEIHCQVAPEARASFHLAQSQWSPVTDADGFLWQLGGWMSGSGNEALILAGWRDAAAHEHFLAPGGLHDRILAENRQMSTMLHWEVQLHQLAQEDLSEHLHQSLDSSDKVSWFPPGNSGHGRSIVLESDWLLQAPDAPFPI